MSFRLNTKIAFAGIGIAALALSACSSSTSSSGGSESPSAVPSVSANETLAAKVPADIRSTGKLEFGTDASYAPSEFLAEDGTTIVGFDVDLGNAIAQKLGLQGNWTAAQFDSIIVGVQSGKYNAGMSSFTINAEREKQVNMVSYFDAGTMWAVPTGNPGGVTVEDPCGKNIAVQKATVQAEEIEATDKKCQADGKAAINIQPYNLQSDATTAVVSGKSDAMLADSPVTAYAIQQSGGKLEQLGDIYGTAPYGVVVAKDQTEFADAISGAINELIADGTYQQILDNWGVGSGAISKSVVNPPVTES